MLLRGLALADRGREQVILELRQLPGAMHRLGVDQQRHVGFFVTMLIGMQVEHELRQRTVQPRQLAAQHGEARTRQLRGGVAIEPAVARAEFDVVLHREIEHARRAPTMLLDVVRFVRARRHAVVRQVGNAERDRVEFGADAFQLDLRRLQFVAEARDLGHQRRDVLALGLGLPDRLAARVAQVLQFLGAHLDALAVGFEAFELLERQLEAAGFAQARGEFGGIGTQQGGIEHGRQGDFRAGS